MIIQQDLYAVNDIEQVDKINAQGARQKIAFLADTFPKEEGGGRIDPSPPAAKNASFFSK